MARFRHQCPDVREGVLRCVRAGFQQHASNAVECRPGSPWRATPDYNANAVREATIEYNEVKARGNKVGEMIPLDRMEAIAEAV